MDIGAQATALLDDLEALLGDDGLTREQRVHRTLDQMRAERAEWKRTRQPWQPTAAGQA